jgi:hypothetical protein
MYKNSIRFIIKTFVLKILRVINIVKLKLNHFTDFSKYIKINK